MKHLLTPLIFAARLAGRLMGWIEGQYWKRVRDRNMRRMRRGR